MVYGSETWALKTAHMELLSVAQGKMERIMIGITLHDHKRNTGIRHQTGVNDIIDVIKKGIHGWAGHIGRFKDNRWTKRVTEWIHAAHVCCLSLFSVSSASVISLLIHLSI